LLVAFFAPQVRLAKEKVKVSQSGISRFLHHINLTFKKTYTRRNKILGAPNPAISSLLREDSYGLAGSRLRIIFTPAACAPETLARTAGKYRKS
jgi:hypothetical protein